MGGQTLHHKGFAAGQLYIHLIQNHVVSIAAVQLLNILKRLFADAVYPQNALFAHTQREAAVRHQANCRHPLIPNESIQILHAGFLAAAHIDGDPAFGFQPYGLQGKQGIQRSNHAGLVVTDTPSVQETVFLHRFKGGGFDPVVIDGNHVRMTENTDAVADAVHFADGITAIVADIHGDAVAPEQFSRCGQNLIDFLAEGQAVLSGFGNGGIANQFHQIGNDFLTVGSQVFVNFRMQFFHKRHLFLQMFSS